MKKAGILLSWALLPLYGIGQMSLGYHLKKDDVFLIKQEADQVIVQELDGATHELKNHIDGLLEFKVMGEKEGHYEIVLSFKDLNLKMDSSIQGALLDVKAKEVTEDDMQSKIFNSLLNYPVQMTLAKNGDILQVVGGDSLVSKMVQASGLEDGFSLSMMKKSLENEFGSEALSNSYEQMTYIYPSNKVGIGDSWKNAFSGKLSTKNHWTLEQVKRGNAQIMGTADVVMHVEEPANSMTLTGTQKTEISTDLETGFIDRMTVNGLATGTSSIPQMGLEEIPTRIESTIVYQRVTE